MKEIKYKRLKVYLLSIIIWILLLLFTSHDPISIATSLMLLSGLYIVNETIRKSDGRNKIQ